MFLVRSTDQLVLSSSRCLSGGRNSAARDRASERPRIGNSGVNCNNIQFPGNAACIVYDDEDCQVRSCIHLLR